MSEYFGELRRRVGREMILVPRAAAIVLDERGAVLLMHCAETGEWCLPGGAMELGESVRGALRRCLRERLGLSSRHETLLGIYSGPTFERRHVDGDTAPVTMVFVVRNADLGGSRARGPTGTSGESLETDEPRVQRGLVTSGSFLLDDLPGPLDSTAERCLNDFVTRRDFAPILE